MAGPKVVVIGGGVAGLSAALAASGQGAKTTLLESSKTVGLSKALMPLLVSDRLSERDLILTQASALAKAGVEARTGEAVSSIERRDGKLRVSSTSGRGSGAMFDSAVICTGAASLVPPLRGISKPNVFVLKEPADYLRLSAEADEPGTVAVTGPIPLALKLGEVLAARGRRVLVYCGKEGLERQFSRPVAAAIRRKASSWQNSESVTLVNGPVDSILGVERAEAITSDGSVSTCDAVVVIPRGVPSFPDVDCEKGRNGGLLVDASMATSLPGVFAAGDSAEVKFKSGSVPARLYATSRTGGEVAGVNAAGGRVSAAPSWAVEQTYFGLEFCAAGLSEEEASAMGIDAATGTGADERETLVSMVYDTETHQVYGLEIAGWRASSLSTTASLIVSLGLTVEQLLHVESPYSPGSSHEVSPIALTAGKIRKLVGT